MIFDSHNTVKSWEVQNAILQLLSCYNKLVCVCVCIVNIYLGLSLLHMCWIDKMQSSHNSSNSAALVWNMGKKISQYFFICCLSLGRGGKSFFPIGVLFLRVSSPKMEYTEPTCKPAGQLCNYFCLFSCAVTYSVTNTRIEGVVIRF